MTLSPRQPPLSALPIQVLVKVSSLLWPAAALLAGCAHDAALVDPAAPPPPPSAVAESGQSEAWSAPTPALLADASAQGFADYRTQLDLARAGSPGAISRIQAFTPFAFSASEPVKASHIVSLRELRQIQPAAFDRALEAQSSVAIRTAVTAAVSDDDTEH